MTKKFAKLWKNLSLCFPFNRSVQEEAYRGVFIIWSADDLDNHTSLLTHSNDRENDLKNKTVTQRWMKQSTYFWHNSYLMSL